MLWPTTPFNLRQPRALVPLAFLHDPGARQRRRPDRRFVDEPTMAELDGDVWIARSPNRPALDACGAGPLIG
jgi:hypothetical protein